MNCLEFANLWMPVTSRFIPPSNRYETAWSRCYKLGDLLGIDEMKKYATTFSRGDLPMTEDLKRLLESLKGPYGPALLKVYRIQRGLEK